MTLQIFYVLWKFCIDSPKNMFAHLVDKYVEDGIILVDNVDNFVYKSKKWDFWLKNCG